MNNKTIIIDSSSIIRQHGFGYVQKTFSKQAYETDRSLFCKNYIQCINSISQKEDEYYKTIWSLLSNESICGIITLNTNFYRLKSNAVNLFGTDEMICLQCGKKSSVHISAEQNFSCSCGHPLSFQFTKYGETLNSTHWISAQQLVASAQTLIVDSKVSSFGFCKALVEYSGKKYRYETNIVDYITGIGKT